MLKFKSYIIIICKAGNKHDLNNYRPVSMIPISRKIMENIIKDDVDKHVEKKRIIHESQHGNFVKGSRCHQTLNVSSTI